MVSARLPRIQVVLPTLCAALVLPLSAAPGDPAEKEDAVPAAAGRFLYAGDDDWDWASPLDAEEPSKLVRYGAMPWSALDWAERGLQEVRGALVGTAPDPRKTMTMERLSEMRGEHATYRHHAQAKGAIGGLLAEADPPNLIILMQNTGKDGALDALSVEALARFVKSGGRLVVLDDWRKYHPVLDALVAEALDLPAGPALEEDPAPRHGKPDRDEDPVAESPEPAPPKASAKPGEDNEKELQKRFEDLLPDLGHETFQVREKATTALRNLGPGVFPLLREAESDDPEIAARLEALRKHFSERLAPGRRMNRTPEERDAQRTAKHEMNARMIKSAAAKLRAAKVSHRVSNARVDKEGRALPVLRISFPIAK